MHYSGCKQHHAPTYFRFADGDDRASVAIKSGFDGCTINGEPDVAIIALEWFAGGNAEVAPLFVAIAKGMEVILHNETQASGDGERRRPLAVCDYARRGDRSAPL